MDDKPRRIIVPIQKSGDGAVRVDRINDVDNLLVRSLGILDEQITKLGLKSRSSIFTEKEARVLQGYVKSLVELSKEEREREKAAEKNGLEGLSWEELVKLGQEQIEKQKQKIGK